METASEIYPLAEETAKKLPFVPLPSQYALMCALDQFVRSPDPRLVFILNGYAGTGKTSITGAFIKTLKDFKHNVVLLAPTGRAAKVASSFSGHPASTIHKRLYRGDTSNPHNTEFFLARNECKNTIFVVDEASLISDYPTESKSLLSHLIHHVYSSPGCKLILIGDEAQLPPVGQSQSWAMSPKRLSDLGLNPIRHVLNTPVRQSEESGIIYNATKIRYQIFGETPEVILHLRASGFPDIQVVTSRDLPEMLSDSWSGVGHEETLLITRSNKRANDFNRAIRNMIMYAEEPLQRGERVIISKNDYYWSKRNNTGSFIANGDTAEITWVGKKEKHYGRYFNEVEMTLNGDGTIINAWVMLRSLVSEGPNVSKTEMGKFYNRVMEAYPGTVSEKIKGVMEDPFYNALQLKYAYCVTCHKAQGGQWKHVYIDMGAIHPDSINEDFYRWLYTAVSRAKEKVFLINPSLPVE